MLNLKMKRCSALQMACIALATAFSGSVLAHDAALHAKAVVQPTVDCAVVLGKKMPKNKILADAMRQKCAQKLAVKAPIDHSKMAMSEGEKSSMDHSKTAMPDADKKTMKEMSEAEMDKLKHDHTSHQH